MADITVRPKSVEVPERPRAKRVSFEADISEDLDERESILGNSLVVNINELPRVVQVEDTFGVIRTYQEPNSKNVTIEYEDLVSKTAQFELFFSSDESFDTTSVSISVEVIETDIEESIQIEMRPA